jgi:hypothetical protein
MGAMILALVIFGFTYVMIMTEWINKTQPPYWELF